MDIASLVYDVSKDLYAFYQKGKSRDDDIKSIRAQLLWMGEKAILIQEGLKRDGAKAEDESNVKQYLQICEIAVAELKSTADKLKTANQSGHETLTARIKARIKTFGRRTAWPLKKETIAALAAYARTCNGALDSAVALLHLNVSVSQIEKIKALDKDIMDGTISLDAAIEDMRNLFQKQLQAIAKELARQTELLKRERDEKQAQKIVESLKFSEMNNRVQQITDARDETYAWLFTPEAEGIPEAQQLVQFLNTGSGLFWIYGDPASGKSTLVKYLANPQRGHTTLWRWEGDKEVTIACQFCWIAGSPILKTQSRCQRKPKKAVFVH
jgi:hypothetical protein